MKRERASEPLGGSGTSLGRPSLQNRALSNDSAFAAFVTSSLACSSRRELRGDSPSSLDSFGLLIGPGVGFGAGPLACRSRVVRDWN